MQQLETLVGWFDSAEQSSANYRANAQRDRDYYNGVQWTAEEQAALKSRGQPCITLNRIGPKIDFIIGTEMRLRSDPKALPRTPNEEQAAECVTNALRYVCDDNQWDQDRSYSYEDQLVEGVGGAEVKVEPSNGVNRIVVEYVPWDRIFWDPHSRFADFRDARYFGTIVWMDVEDAMQNPKWAQRADVFEYQETSPADDDTYSDRPRFGVWTTTAGNRKRIKISKCEWKEGGEWWVAVFTKGGFLEDPRPSPYVDEFGKTVPCLILQSAKVDRNNDRYGVVRALISPQDEINKRRSKALHLLSMRQVITEKGAIDDPYKAIEQLSRPDGFIEVTPGMRFEINPTGDLASGQVQLYLDAKAEMDAVGANAALTGKDPRNQSGIAIQSRQQGGLLELQKIFDGLRAWSLRCYRHMWYAVRQFWTHETWLRVTDSDEHMRWVPINKRVTVADELKNQGIDPQQYLQSLGVGGSMIGNANTAYPPPPTGALGPAAALGTATPGAPQGVDPVLAQQLLSQVTRIENHVAYLDVDIVLDESQDTVVLQQEQFNTLAQLAQAGLPIPPEAIIEASSIRDKKRIIDMMKGGGVSPEQQQAAMQAQAQAQAVAQQALQLDMAQKAADIDKTQSETIKNKAAAAVSIHEAAQQTVDQRMQQMGPMMPPAVQQPAAPTPYTFS